MTQPLHNLQRECQMGTSIYKIKRTISQKEHAIAIFLNLAGTFDNTF